MKVAIRSWEEDKAHTFDTIDKALRGEIETPVIELVFESFERMRSFLTPERMRLLTAVRTEKPASVYELARVLERDRKAVEADVELLRGLGLLKVRRRKRNGRKTNVPIVPYDRIEIAIELKGNAEGSAAASS